MPIEQIAVKNYRVLQDVKIAKLPRLAVVIGANGTGKSTLFDVFSFLKDALASNVSTAVAKRGGFKELVSRGQEGPVGITVKFRESSGRLATYLLEIGTSAGRPVVQHEVLRYTRRSGAGRPWHFVDFREGIGTAITNESMYGEPGVEEERGEYELDDPATLAIKGLGQFREFRVVSEFRSLIDNWHISNLHIADARASAEAGYAEHLSTLGENVAQVAQYLFDNHRGNFQRVLLDAMRQRVPGVETVDARPTEDGRLSLAWKALHASARGMEAIHRRNPVAVVVGLRPQPVPGGGRCAVWRGRRHVADSKSTSRCVGCAAGEPCRKGLLFGRGAHRKAARNQRSSSAVHLPRLGVGGAERLRKVHRTLCLRHRLPCA